MRPRSPAMPLTTGLPNPGTARSEAAASTVAGNRVPVAAQFLALSDHPGLAIWSSVFIRVGDGTRGRRNSGSRLVMETPRFHNTLRNAQGERGSHNGVPQTGGNPRCDRDVLRRVRPFVLTASFVEDARMAKKRKI